MLWIALHLPLLSLETFAATLAGEASAEPLAQAGKASMLPLAQVDKASMLPLALADKASMLPLALMRTERASQRLVAVNSAARALGVETGITRSSALALAPQLRLGQAEPARDAEALQAVAHVALGYTPNVSIPPACGAAEAMSADTVLLEVQPSLRYFGGLPALKSRLRAGLAPLGHRLHLVSAPTALGATLLARIHRECHCDSLASLGVALDAAPVWLLGPGRVHWEALQGMGLHTLADLRALPRSGLARRFGEAVLDEFDRAFGHRPDPREPIVLPPTFESRLELFARADTTEQVLHGASLLLPRLVAWLAAQHAQARRFTLVMAHEPRWRASQTPPATPPRDRAGPAVAGRRPPARPAARAPGAARTRRPDAGVAPAVRRHRPPGTAQHRTLSDPGGRTRRPDPADRAPASPPRARPGAAPSRGERPSPGTRHRSRACRCGGRLSRAAANGASARRSRHTVIPHRLGAERQRREARRFDPSGVAAGGAGAAAGRSRRPVPGGPAAAAAERPGEDRVRLVGRRPRRARLLHRPGRCRGTRLDLSIPRVVLGAGEGVVYAGAVRVMRSVRTNDLDEAVVKDPVMRTRSVIRGGCPPLHARRQHRQFHRSLPRRSAAGKACRNADGSPARLCGHEGELLIGLPRRPEATALKTAVKAFLRHLQVLPWNSAAAAAYGVLRATLESRGTPLDNLDLLIASRAVATDSTLVSNDPALARTPGLQVEDWTLASAEC